MTWSGTYHTTQKPEKTKINSNLFPLHLQATLSSSILFVILSVLACTWAVQGMSNVYYTSGPTACDVCPSGTTYVERRVITQPSRTYSPPHYTVQGRVVNDNTITQQANYDYGTVDSNFIKLVFYFCSTWIRVKTTNNVKWIRVREQLK